MPEGRVVKPVIVCILSVVLGQAVSVPAVALADTSSASGLPHTDTMKKYLKHQKKEQKKARKSQRRAEKSWKKGHHTEH
jgi:uncharacterized protein (DUF3084 family)